MKNHIAFLLATAAFVLVAAAPAFAGDNTTIVAADNQLSVGLLTQNINYAEHDGQGGLLDTEKGSISGIGTDFSYMGNVYADFQYNFTNGYTDYVGQPSTGGSYGTLTGSSQANTRDYKIRVGKDFAMGNDFVITPYAEFGHHYWFRGVNSGETYKHYYWGIGTLAQTSIGGFVLSGYAMDGRTFGSHIDIAGSSGFSDNLGNSNIYDAGASVDYGFSNAIHVSLGVDFSGFKYGKSGVHTIPGSGTTWEPASTTRYTTTRLAVGYGF